MTRKAIFFNLIIIVLLAVFFHFSSPVHALEKVEVTTIDPQADGYGTFQSHNQKVVANQYGIFMTHLHSKTEAFINNTWRLSRSTDGGKTFTTVYEAANATHAPVLEAAPNGYLYVIYSGETDATLVRFNPNNNFSTPEFIATIPSGSAQKFAMILDWSRQQIYYAATHNFNDFRFYVITLNGEIKINEVITQPGPSAQSHYPLLSMDTDNNLYLAWTTVNNGDLYLYWDIHFVFSKDGGNNWRKPHDGGILDLPIVADETGPTYPVTLGDEYSTQTWLWNLLVKNGKAFFPYLAQSGSGRQHMVRVDLATGREDKNIYPEWKGETISLLNLDGFCATDLEQTQFPVFCSSRTRDGKLGVLVSYDNGNSWHDYALSDYTGDNYYAIGGAREITPDGYLIGSYTTANVVRFFRVKVSAKPIIPGDLTADGKVDIYDYNELVAGFGTKYTIFDYNNLVANYGK